VSDISRSDSEQLLRQLEVLASERFGGSRGDYSDTGVCYHSNVVSYETFTAFDLQVQVRNPDGSVRLMTYFWQSWIDGSDATTPESPEFHLQIAAAAWDAQSMGEMQSAEDPHERSVKSLKSSQETPPVCIILERDQVLPLVKSQLLFAIGVF